MMKHLLSTCILFSTISTATSSTPFFPSNHGVAFQFPSFPKLFQPKSSSTTTTTNPFKPLEKQKKELLTLISNTNNGKTATPSIQKQVLKLVRTIEIENPPPSDLLTNPSQAKSLLDGTWYLQYTSPSEIESSENVNENGTKDNSWKAINAEEGDSRIPTEKFNAQGSISAKGINVDTSNKPVLQILDIDNTNVQNDVVFDFGTVSVGGYFRASSSVPNRAIVGFTYGTIAVEKPFRVTLSLDWLFDLISKVRGTQDSGWLETTFVSGDVRIGRGNKGTLFVLTKDLDAVSP